MYYRENGFAGAQIKAKKICEQMNTPHISKRNILQVQNLPTLPMKHLTNYMKTYLISERPIFYFLFLNRAVDSAITSVENIFQTMRSVKDEFGLFWDLKQTTEKPKELLSKRCNNLQNNSSSKHKLDCRFFFKKL